MSTWRKFARDGWFGVWVIRSGDPTLARMGLNMLRTVPRVARCSARPKSDPPLVDCRDPACRARAHVIGLHVADPPMHRREGSAF